MCNFTVLILLILFLIHQLFAVWAPQQSIHLYLYHKLVLVRASSAMAIRLDSKAWLLNSQLSPLILIEELAPFSSFLLLFLHRF